MVPDAGREGRALHEGGRALHRQVREPGRGREGLRGGPRDRSREPRRRSNTCARCTRSVATGRSSSVSSGARPSASYGDERAREVPRDREARDRARQEARGLHRALGRGARQRSGERRGARRARRSLRALEGVRQARRRAREAGRGHLRQRARRSDPHEARHDLRRSSEQRRRRRRRVARAPRARSERSQGAGSAQEEVPRARSLGRPRGLLRRDRQVGRVHPRPRAARGEGDRRRGEDRPALQDRRALGDTEAEERSRRARLREDPRARAQNLRAAEALIPIYAQADNAKGLANAIEVKLSHEEDAVREARAPARGRRALRGQGQATRRRRSSATSRPSSSSPRDEQTTRRRRARRAATGELGRRVDRRVHARRSSRPTTPATRRSRSRSA